MKKQLFKIGEISCYTHPSGLKVNGSEAEYEDFVTIDYECRNYCCENINVKPVNRVTKVLSTMKKYNLTPEDMEEIQDAIVEKINGRSCGLCN